MQQEFLLSTNLAGFHRIAYTRWGNGSALPPVICAHGLTRNGRDFDRLAETLAAEGRAVFCPDAAGRGRSDWLPDALSYSYAQYALDSTALIARTGAAQVDWVGTSMGGILGMHLAARANTPVRKLVINDVGPFIARWALQRIGSYIGITPEFADLGAVERYMRQIYAPFGIARDEDWRHLAAHGHRVLPNGKLALNYDPAIAKPFQAIAQDADFWEAYDRITAPTLLLRGALSDVLSRETAEEMTRRGPRARLVEIPGLGHAPGLMDAEQIRLIADFLRE